MKDPVHDWERQLAGSPPIKNGFTSNLEQNVRERIHMKKTPRRFAFRIAAAALSVIILLGFWWFHGDIDQLHSKLSTDTKSLSSTDINSVSRTSALKVQKFPDVPFEETIEKPYLAAHPAEHIDVISASLDEYKDSGSFISWMEEQKPDVVQVPIGIYAELVEQGKLKALDSMIASSHFDLDALHQPLIQLLRAAGNGELFGLANEFASSGLYINEDLFRKYDIPIPKDGMTMEEVLQTAARFKGTGAYGLGTMSLGDPFRLVSFIGQSEGLSLLERNSSEEGYKFNNGWSGVWKQVADGYRDGWIANEGSDVASASNENKSVDELINQSLFVQGKVAMELGSSFLYSNLMYEEAHMNLSLQWSTRSVELASSATNQGQYLNPGLVYAINAASDKSDAAWKLIAFIAGKENKRNTQFYNFEDTYMGLSAREENMNELPATQWGAFYEAKVDPLKVLESVQGYKDPVYQESVARLNELASKQLNAVTEGTITATAAFQQLQEQLEQQLR